MVIVSRAPTPTIEPQEVLRPQATPVDTYIRPPDPAPSDLHNLAKGLENFSRDIRGMFQAREARDEEAARIRGEAQFFQDNAVGYAEAVRQGKIPAFASRPFMESYKQAEGKLVGARLASQMQMEYQTWEGRNSQDPANFDTFMADFLKRNLTTQDPDVLKGAMPYIYSTVNAGYTARTQDAADAAYNGGLNANIAVSSMAIDDASTAGLTSGQGTDYDALWDNLIKNRTTALSSGIRSGDYDTKFVDVIAAKAIEERDPALLALLDRTIPGEANPVSATPYGREVKAKTINALETVNYQAENAAYTAQQRRDAALKDELTAFAIDAITADPNVVLPENFWREFTKVDPEARVKVQDWRNAVMNGLEENEEEVNSLTYRVLVGGENAMAVINEGVQSGIIRDAATLKRLYDMGTETPVWQRSQAYQLGLKAIQNAAGQGNSFGFDPNYVSPAATAASLDFELSMRAWAQSDEGKAAIAGGNMAAIASETARVQKAITDGFIITQGAPATYVQPTEVTEDLEQAGFAPNPQAFTQRQTENQAQATARADRLEVSGTGEMPQWGEEGLGELIPLPADEQFDIRWMGEASPDLNTLPPEEQTAIREEADKMGIDPQILLEQTYRQVDELIRGVDQGFDLEQGIQNLIDNAPALLNSAPGAPPGQVTPMSQSVLNEVLEVGRADPTYFDMDPSGIQDHTATTAGTWNFGTMSNPNALVVHHTAGGGEVDGVIQTFKDRNYPAHFVIDKQGVIHRILQDNQRGQHTRPAQDGSDISNANSWGVEIIAADDSDLNPAQIRASVQLANYLHNQYGMPLDRVVGHGNINDHKQHTEGDTVLAAIQSLYGEQEEVPSGEPGGVESLLAFIAQEEGTGGSYNMVYGGQEQPLTDMSIAQVRGIGKAAGKYQMMPDTLGDAQQAFGLSPDTKFTPEVQEQIVMWLLERRGLAQWREGRMSDDQFIDNLSMEWAALAGSSGTAFYEGQGQNASLSRLKDVLASIW